MHYTQRCCSRCAEQDWYDHNEPQTARNATDSGLISDSARWAQPADYQEPETALTPTDRLALLNFEIETMRNSEGTPFFDEQAFDAMLKEWEKLTALQDQND